MASLGREEMAKLLTVGAEVQGYLTHKAAAHLITFTELMGAPTFAPHVEVAEVQTLEGETVTAAFVKDWASLVTDDRLYFLSGNNRRLMRMAASFHGVQITLSEEATGLGHAHARRLVEAMMITTRITEQGLYHLVEGPGMDRVRARSSI